MDDFRMVLETIYAINRGERSSEDLCFDLGVSRATLKRYIGRAQHLGAAIESVKLGNRWFYHCANYGQLEQRLLAWMRLERERTLF